jgi:prepilin-type N-terminal cleavage/methylation domain-containing protein
MTSVYGKTPQRISFKENCRLFSAAFTLIELLTVIAIMVILLVAVGPAVSSMSGRSFAKSVGDTAMILEQARTYAMANNTYVYVGLFESDASQADTARPQSAGVGRLHLGVVASRDGTTGYLSGWATTNLVSISRIKHLEGLDLVSASTASTMDNSAGNQDLSQLTAATKFSGTDMGLSSANNPVHTFDKVIQFSPSGSANVVTSLGDQPTVPPYIQLAFVPTHANVKDKTVANWAGLQIDGVTGIVRTFKPGQL